MFLFSLCVYGLVVIIAPIASLISMSWPTGTAVISVVIYSSEYVGNDTDRYNHLLLRCSYVLPLNVQFLFSLSRKEGPFRLLPWMRMSSLLVENDLQMFIVWNNCDIGEKNKFRTSDTLFLKSFIQHYEKENKK